MKYAIEVPQTPSLTVTGTDVRFPVNRVFCVGRNYAAHARENLLKKTARIQTELDYSHGDSDGDRFWRGLYASDAAREHGKLSLARARYGMLIDFVTSLIVRSPVTTNSSPPK